ncbi:MAG: OmpA family protein [Hyphomicrobium sp.]|nr:OmpA family protein [Hyphomicrobium sp.]
MSDAKFDLAKEVVIVRRRKGGGEDGHHGGAWKIAYADFMTAMMAFFLVMWLVSMTDDKTIVQIANYFNPLQLTDAAATKKGLRDADPKAPYASHGDRKEEMQAPSASPRRKADDNARKEKAAAAEARMFVDPMESLEAVASQAFDIGASQTSIEEFGLTLGDSSTPGQQRDATDAFDSGVGAGSQVRESRDVRVVPGAAATRPSTSGGEGIDAAQDAALTSDADKRYQSVAEKILKATQGIRGVGPQVSVTHTGDGILVSVMDHDGFEMFRRGSAEPQPHTLKLLERITPILRAAGGNIVIRGHTDAANFRTSSYDNWRLSTARAHMAQYMLRRAGLRDEQLEKIEGMADKALRVPSNPYAAQNRRIEILLRAPKS